MTLSYFYSLSHSDSKALLYLTEAFISTVTTGQVLKGKITKSHSSLANLKSSWSDKGDIIHGI